MQELTLEEKKKIAFQILVDLDALCAQYHLTYFLGYGSLIGAIRHQGFIPWDDDIDIWVPIETYKQFLDLVKKETSYAVLDNTSDIGWSRSFAKVSDTRTVIYNEQKKSRTLSSYGVSVDIFPLFGIPETPNWSKKLLQNRDKVVYLQRYRLGLYQGASPANLKKKLWAKLSLALGKDEKYYKSRILELELSSRDTRCVGCVISVYRTKDIHARKDFSKTIDVIFEGHTFQAPIGYDRILRKLYGDYMQLPPPEKRVAHDSERAFWIPDQQV